MKPINVEILTSHSTGVSDSYYRPVEKDLLEDYLKAVQLLTINNDKLILQRQVTELTEKSKNNEYIIKSKLQEKDEELKKVIEKMLIMQQEQKEMRTQLTRQRSLLNKALTPLYDLKAR